MNLLRKFLLFLTSCIIVISTTSCDFNFKSKEDLTRVSLTTSPITFTTVPVTKGNIQPQSSANGSINSTEKHNIYPSMEGGILDEVYFKVFDTVKKGDVIAKLYSENIDSQVRIQELSVKRKELELSKLIKDKSDQYLIEICKIDLAIEKETLANLTNKKENLILRSPIDGVITDITKTARGVYLNSTDVVAVVDNINELVLTGKIDSNFKDVYYKGMKATIIHDKQEYTGELVDFVFETDSILKKEPGVYIKFTDNVPDGLKLNMTLNYTLFGEKKENVLIVPIESLGFDGTDYYVSILKDGLRQRKKVQIGSMSYSHVEIVSGLELNEEVVVK